MRGLFLALTLTTVAASQDVKPAFELPAPTGEAVVGTTTWRVIDDARQETLGEARGPRAVEVIAYYPARDGSKGDTAPYLRAGRAEARALIPSPAGDAALDSLAAVRTHAIVDAEPRAGSDHLPLILFSHGFGGFASSHAALLEDLASHGYVVLNINHPYESGGATLANGDIASFLGADGKPRASFFDVVGEWGKEDETMAAVTKSENDQEQRRLLKGYLATLQRTDAALKRWVADTRLVLDRFGSMPAGTIAARLAARADASRVGVAGHSMGGVTAGQFCIEDVRCRGGLNLDGIPQYGAMIDTPTNKPFLMVYSERPGRAGASDPIYRRAAAPYYRVDVKDTLHLDFSDLNFWPTRLRERKALGAIAPERAAEITRAIVKAYFDEVLGGRPSTLAALPKEFAEVTFRRVAPQAQGDAAPMSMAELLPKLRAAHQARDAKSFLEWSRALVKLRPRSPRALITLASAHAMNGDASPAVALLDRLTRMGASFDISADPDFDPIRQSPELAAAIARARSLEARVGASPVAFRLDDPDLALEGIAYDPKSRAFFLSSVHERKVLRRSADGAVTDFSRPADNLMAVMALDVDARRRRLWITTAGLPPMQGFKKDEENVSALVEYNIDTGAVLRRLPPPSGVANAMLSDLAVAPNGDVFVADPLAGRLYVLRQGANAITLLTDSGPIVSAQGIAPSRDGRYLFVADYAQGIVRVDQSTGTALLLPAPDDVAVTDVDGLVLHGRDLIGIQNGFRPHRVVRVVLDDAQARIVSVETLERNHPEFDEPTLGVVVHDDFYYVANSQSGRRPKSQETKVVPALPAIVRLRLPTRR